VRSLLAEPFKSGAEDKLALRLDRRLLVDRSDGSLLDFDLTDDRLSGTTTTGIPPFRQTARRAFPLDMELIVLDDTRLS
jgi:hypothetical protein